MEQIIKYVCSFCNKEFYSEEKCAICESSHVPATQFDTAAFMEGRKYPTFVYMVSDDNHMLSYAYKEDLGLYQQEEPEPNE